MTNICRPAYILPAIVLAQLLGSSTWFAGNAILPILQDQWQLPDSAVAPLTNSVQFGFIVGALLFSVLALADRFSPRLVFFFCALGSALLNVQIALWAETLDQVLWLRFFGGVLLAGIYPVGMKIATGWYPEGLGRALGYLLGALAIGTSSAHLFSSLQLPGWEPVIYLSCLCAVLGGLIVLFFVPDGPALHKGQGLSLKDLWVAIKHKPLQGSAGGYFGHMWELYAVWALLPYWLIAWSKHHNETLNIPFWSFYLIAVGALGCVLGGYLSQRIGSRRVALYALLGSGMFCVLSPWLFELGFVSMILLWSLWGMLVVADSPQFSALSAQTAPKAVVGSALTMINAIGFTITIGAVQLSASLLDQYQPQWIMWLLAPGPFLGIISLVWLKRLRPEL